MPLLSHYARAKKLEFLASHVRPDASVLEIGPGDGWLRGALAPRVAEYRTVDLSAPADFVGDVRRWRQLGLAAGSFDLVVALEVVEHVPCLDDIHALLKPGGQAFLTSPVPHWDWLCAVLERAGLSQRRTSPHSHLLYFDAITELEPLTIRRFGLLSQWGLFQKPAPHAA